MTFPGVRASTLDAARRVASWGQRIHAFALGDAALAASELYEELAELTDGSLVRLEAPGDLIARLRRVVLTDLEHLEVRNDSSGLAAMALRIHPNGSFDAFVPLTPGENRLVVRALLSDGSQASVTRSVRYEPQDTPEQQAQLKVLMQELERRTLQLELWAEMERSRRLQRKVIELELGEPTP